MKPLVLVVLSLGALAGFLGHDAAREADAANLPRVAGDADCDEHVTPVDALTVALDAANVSSGFCVQLGNVLCEDALDMDDAIAILRFLAHLDIDQGARCFVPGVMVQDMIESEGTATIHGTFLFDFDTGTETNGGGDIQWENDGTSVPNHDMFMTPTGGMTLLLPDFPAYPVLNTVWLAAIPYNGERIDGPGGVSPGVLFTGSAFGVVTDQGNFAKVKVLQAGYDLQIEWVTYSKPSQ